jgi:hypothetical protein
MVGAIDIDERLVNKEMKKRKENTSLHQIIQGKSIIQDSTITVI